MLVTKLTTSQSSQTSKTSRPLINRRLKTISSMQLNTQSPEIHLQPSIITKQNILINNNNFIYSNVQDHQDGQMTFLHDNKTMRQEIIESNRSNRDNKKIQDDNSGDIVRMKLMYQSRLQNHNQKQNKMNNYNRSMDRSPQSKSIQKHTLKPTNTPNLKRVFLLSQQPQQQFLQQVQSPNFSYQNKHQPTHHMINSLHSQQNNTMVREIQDPLLNTIYPIVQKKNLLQCSGISSKFAEYEFGSEIKASGGMGEFNRVGLKEEGSERKGAKNHEEFTCQQAEGRMQMVSNSVTCTCSNMFRQFMQQTTNTISDLTSRLITLQTENTRLLKLQSKFILHTQLIQQYKHQVQLMQTKYNQLKQSNFSYKTEKEQLELLLKQILFKREKEKYHKTSTNSSKENTQRYDHGAKSRVGRNSAQSVVEVEDEFGNDNYVSCEKKGDILLKKDHSFIVKKGVEPLGQKSTNTNHPQKLQKLDKKSQHQSDSKIKMQNLLSKIQIKIQKS